MNIRNDCHHNKTSAPTQTFSVLNPRDLIMILHLKQMRLDGSNIYKASLVNNGCDWNNSVYMWLIV